ncbi:hypothetical protein CWI38_2150p0010 [Hamiltosporidium tvaerminnensis]|uniref:Uncharacterized protein n=1 Tax=Hamiltosporidium tvaerminnensis TaxID=1176355 RepID=A0A4V2JWX6_9MICR|nr:hypothetical protein CWI37_1317p0010 [Hamiltosporidium tvaerminnensis]TBU09432.1 hypothetical protein CWI38_2150p0010 [Hamiltosporidium tvaerminnensis]
MIFYFVLLNVKTTLVNARNVSRNLGLPTECSIFSCIPKRIPRSISTFYYGVFPDYEYDNSQNMKGANSDIIKRNHRKITKALYDKCSTKIKCNGKIHPLPND